MLLQCSTAEGFATLEEPAAWGGLGRIQTIPLSLS